MEEKEKQGSDGNPNVAEKLDDEPDGGLSREERIDSDLDHLYEVTSDHDERLDVIGDRIDHLVRSHNALDSKIDRRCSRDCDRDYYPHGDHTAQMIAKLECELAILRANRRTIVDEVSDWVMKHRSGLIVLCLCAIIVVATITLGDAYRGMQVMP